MRTFIIAERDPFSSVFTSRSTPGAMGTESVGGKLISSGFDHVRRPLRGIQLKRNTYATLEVVTAANENIHILNSSVEGGRGARYSNFILQQIHDQRAERQQLVQTFGETWVFFAGQAPQILQAAGVLINSDDFRWRSEWWFNYENYLRGTKCARAGARLYLSWDDVLVEGYMLNANSVEDANEPYLVRFDFSFLVTRYTSLSITDSGSATFPEGADLGSSKYTPPAYVSEALRVRQLNALSMSASQGSAGGLLFNLADTMKTVKQGTNRFSVTLEQLAYGRNIKVPFGFAGGEATRTAPELAQGSFFVGWSGPGYRVKVAMPQTEWYRKRRTEIWDNYDEYPERSVSVSSPAPGRRLQDLRTLSESEAESRAKKILEGYGLDTEGMAPWKRFLGKAVFGVVNVALAYGVNEIRQSRQPKPLQPWASDRGRVVSSRTISTEATGTDQGELLAPEIISNPARG